MHRNQYFHKHRNLNIEGSELQRKYIAYLREQEALDMAQRASVTSPIGGSDVSEPSGGLPSNCIEFTVDTTDGDGFGMEFTTSASTGFTIDYGDGDSLSDTADGTYSISHTYPAVGEQYTARLCFDDASSVIALEFYGND
jgi:hypothetical protein